MTFRFGGKKATYTTPNNVFYFFQDQDNGSSAYDVFIKGGDRFYLPDRTLVDLTDPSVSTEEMMQRLEHIGEGEIIKIFLKTHKLLEHDLHVALLQLRIFEQEEEIRQVYSRD